MAFKTWQKYALTIVPFLLVGAVLMYFGDIVSYIILAWVVSMMGRPLFNFFNKYLGSSFSAGLTLLIFSLLLFLLLRLFIPPLVNQAKNIAGVDYHKVVAGLEEPISDFKLWLTEKGILHEDVIEDVMDSPEETKVKPITTFVDIDSLIQKTVVGDSLLSTNINLLIQLDQPEQEKQIQNKEENYLEGIRNNIFETFNPSKISNLISSLVGFFGGIMITILSVFFIAFFFLKEKGLFTKMVSFLVPNHQEGKVTHAISESSTLLVRYFVGLVAQVTIVTIIATIVLKLFGFQSALLMAFCFAVFNLIPYLGPLLGNFFGVLIVISSNLNTSFYDVMLPQMIKVVIIFAVLQLIDNFLVQPNIFSKSVKAHPLEIFLVVLMGAKIGGVAGMVLAIPVYTVLRVLLKVFFSEFEVVKRLTSGL